MGLDMYLNKKTYIGANFSFNNVTGTLALKRDDVPIDINLNKLKYVLEEQAYWRKANAIHKWFVDNVQGGVDDCRVYEVYGEKLLELVKLCKEILADHSKAEDLLPPCSGFFFGGTEYDEYYFECLEDTIEQLANVEADCYYEYDSSW